MERPEPVVPSDARILVVKLADIGDAVLSLPAIQALRASLPDATIDVLTTDAGANVFRLSLAIDSVTTLAKQRFDHIQGLISPSGILALASLTARLRAARYDAVVILHHFTTSFGARKFQALARATGASVVAGLDNGRGTFLTHRAIDYGFGTETEWQYGLDIISAIGIDPVESRPRLSIPEASAAAARDLISSRLSSPSSKFAIVHAEVGDFSPARAWRDDHFADIARELVTRHFLPVLAVGVDPARAGLKKLFEVDGVHDLVGQTTFPELCELVRTAEIVVGCDSSVAHLAGAFDRPSITLFGPSNINAWRPYGSEVLLAGSSDTPAGSSVAVHLGMPCSPCIYPGYRLGRPQGCRSRTCMTAMDPHTVTQRVGQLLPRAVNGGS